MSKSIFTKYLMTFTSLLLVGFLMLLLIFYSVIGDYSKTTKESFVIGAAKAAVADLSDMFGESGMADFAAYVHRDRAAVDRILRAIITNADDIAISVTDTAGTRLVAVGVDRETAEKFAHTGDSLSAILGTAQSGTPVSLLGEGKERLCYGLAVTDAEGEVIGTVVVTAPSGLWADMSHATVRSVGVIAIWIIIAALIALYYVTEQIIAPLREMSRAAKLMAVGKFDTRIQVRGRDEVAELATAFNQMSESLKNLEQLRNSFVANVSHDLRTPMTTIAGFIDGILDGVIPASEEKHYLQVVSEEVRRLSRMVNQLLDLSRLQAGERKMEKQPFDICEAGRQILISLEQKIESRHLDVSFTCDEERMYVLGDRDAIYQVLYNICDNAVKFSYEGGALSLRFAWQEPDARKGRKVLVTVFNQGQGIAKEDLPFIFERFYKADKSRGLDKGGTGLGMFIAKTIIQAHGEQITVSSEYGENCTFSFTLPASAPPPRISQRQKENHGGDAV